MADTVKDVVLFTSFKQVDGTTVQDVETASKVDITGNTTALNRDTQVDVQVSDGNKSVTSYFMNIT